MAQRMRQQAKLVSLASQLCSVNISLLRARLLGLGQGQKDRVLFTVHRSHLSNHASVRRSISSVVSGFLNPCPSPS